GMNGTTATTHALNAPIYLISDQRGMVLNQAAPHPDMGAIQSAGTTPTVGLGMPLKIGLSSGSLNGTTTLVTNSLGQATFNNLWIPTAGSYQLSVANGLALSSSFTVSSGSYPIVTSVNPSSAAAGATISISGSNFTGATAVSFGNTPATGFVVNS